MNLKNFLINTQSCARKTRSFILDLVLPLNCLGCGREGSWLCPDCQQNLLKCNNVKNCFSCGKKSNFGDLCAFCSPLFYFDNIHIAGNYQDNLLAQLIKIYKYRFAKEISIVLAEHVYKYLLLQRNNGKAASQKNKIDFSDSLFIPVPLHKKRQRWRGFNQAELLAKELIKKLSGELESKNLQRIKFHLPQTRLKKQERKKNVENAFVWQGKNLKKQNIILIDDIVTTGSTLNECARILKQNNAGQITCLTVAHGL